ncbi:MAG: hypothetical protein HY317_05850 [Acidobacteria bacterium]|nr:hypothetical protein [Acidobacteriota bacterium]
MRLRLALVAVVALAVRPAAGDEGGAALLPDVFVRLTAARYSPTETDLHWTGWIGAGAGLVRIGGTTAYFDADVETILGDTRRPFEANQANYHLAVGLRRRVGKADVALFFHHVSRHEVDRPKPEAVDWNVLGLRASLRLPEGSPIPARVSASVGHTTLASLVGYRWEVTARGEADVLTRRWATLYLTADARLVTADSSEQFPRNGFADLRVEAGPRWRRDGRSLELYAAYERRNDVFIVGPGTRVRALFGFRIGYVSGPERP